MPLSEGPSSSPVISSEIVPGVEAGSAEIERGGEEGGDAALHVDRAAAIDHAVLDRRGEGRMAPASRIAGRHDVGMAGEDEMRRAGAEGREEILDIRRAGLAEDGPLDGETRRLAERFPGRRARRPRPALPTGSGSMPATALWRRGGGQRRGAIQSRTCISLPRTQGSIKPGLVERITPRRSSARVGALDEIDEGA